MRKHAAVVIGFLMLACLLIAGCDDSSVPLSDANQASLDKELIGLWKHKHQNGVTYTHVGRLGGEAPKGVMRMVMVSRSKSDELREPYEILAFRSTIAGQGYLNICGLAKEQLDAALKDGWPSGQLKSYLLVKYRVDRDALLLWPMDNEAKKKAIEAGKIKGVIKDATYVRFTDTTENLVKFAERCGNFSHAGECEVGGYAIECAEECHEWVVSGEHILKVHRLRKGGTRMGRTTVESWAVVTLSMTMILAIAGVSQATIITGPYIPGDLCDALLGKPLAIEFQYVYGVSVNTAQDSKAGIIFNSGLPDDDGTSWIIVTDEGDASSALGGAGSRHFQGNVLFNETFVADEVLDSFGSQVYVHFFDDDTGGSLLQSVFYHTSCSAPIQLGDVIGSATLVAYQGDSGSASIDGNPIPEPSTIAIWSLLGLAGLGYGWRKKRTAP